MKYEELEVYIPQKTPANYIDLTGTETEYFKIISRAPNKGSGTRWNCQCKICGDYCVKDRANLFRDKSCGCQKKNNIGKALRKDLAGQRFGNLVAIEYTGRSNASKNAIWRCKCDCGTICEVDSNNLSSLHTTSCGCVKESIGAKNIRDILSQENISFITEYPIYGLEGEDDKHPYRFDFALTDSQNNILKFIEYDGIQHFMNTWGVWETRSSLENQQKRDKAKNEYALSHNIPLVRIPYWERDNITLDMITGDQYLVKE